MTHPHIGSHLAPRQSVPEIVCPGNHLDRASFRAVAEHSGAICGISGRRSRKSSNLRPASHSIEARLSRSPLHARDLCSHETLPLTQELLAGMIGVRRNAISIVAHEFQWTGVISDSRGHIDIDDPQSLEAASCQSYRAASARHDDC